MTEPVTPESIPAHPIQLTMAWVLLLFEGAAAVVAGGVWALRSLIDQPQSLGASLAGAAFAIISGAVIGRLAFSLRVLQIWSRSPLITVQILLLPVGFALIAQGNNPTYGVPILAVAIVLMYLLLCKPVSSLLDRHFD